MYCTFVDRFGSWCCHRRVHRGVGPLRRRRIPRTTGPAQRATSDKIQCRQSNSRPIVFDSAITRPVRGIISSEALSVLGARGCHRRRGWLVSLRSAAQGAMKRACDICGAPGHHHQRRARIQIARAPHRAWLTVEIDPSRRATQGGIAGTWGWRGCDALRHSEPHEHLVRNQGKKTSGCCFFSSPPPVARPQLKSAPRHLRVFLIAVPHSPAHLVLVGLLTGAMPADASAGGLLSCWEFLKLSRQSSCPLYLQHLRNRNPVLNQRTTGSGL